ncbi:HAMP domain-containing protein [candidate division KSB1 bacterium]|nr:HAMP domain-containing protein [candidate division KSB1 bacterium]
MTRQFLRLENLFNVLWERGNDVFGSFPIRRKLSIILVMIVTIVIAIITTIFQQSEERLLKSKLEDVCTLSVRYLSYDIKDKLLLKKYEEITERVLSIKQQPIEGLDYAWVINSSGQYVSHTDKSISLAENQSVPDDLMKYLSTLTDVGTRETSTHYEFYYPIFFTRTENGVDRNIFVGAAGIGFLKHVILTPIRDAQKIIITIALLVTIISILGIYFIAQRMVKQIQALSEGAKQIGEGNLSIKIRVNSRDELGQLAQEFNNMTMHLKEKVHMQKFVSQMTRQMIKKNIISSDNNNDGEQREVAVLFADVRNFSAFSQRHNPQFVIHLINIYLNLQAQIIEENFGIVDKFMGDQIMGVFEGKNKSENMLKAAVTIQKEIRQLNDKRQKSKQEILTVGIGLNTGPAVVGHIGSKDRLDYTVVGDAVNLASRFCDVAKPGQIITSVDLFDIIKDRYPAMRIGSIPIKGRLRPVDICEIDYLREIIM